MGKLRSKIAYIRRVAVRNNRLSYRVIKGRNVKSPKIIGMVRIRNESLILKDTLDSLSKHVDGVIIYDDSSDDNSVEIAINHPIVYEAVVNKRWRKGRSWEETANRSLLLRRARRFKPEWLFYSDADERFEGDIYDFLTKEAPPSVSGIKISLFDAYITQNDQESYLKGHALYNFRKFFGVERRDILMIWRNNPGVKYIEPDSRQPSGINGEVIVRFYCQHYGKALSVDHWEETCKYYYENFPEYSAKWKDRMGKAVHKLSDFNTKLVSWADVKKSKELI